MTTENTTLSANMENLFIYTEVSGKAVVPLWQLAKASLILHAVSVELCRKDLELFNKEYYKQNYSLLEAVVDTIEETDTHSALQNKLTWINSLTDEELSSKFTIPVSYHPGSLVSLLEDEYKNNTYTITHMNYELTKNTGRERKFRLRVSYKIILVPAGVTNQTKRIERTYSSIKEFISNVRPATGVARHFF